MKSLLQNLTCNLKSILKYFQRIKNILKIMSAW